MPERNELMSDVFYTYRELDSRPEHERSIISGAAFKPKHDQTKYEAGRFAPQPLRWLEESSDEISEVNNPVPDASLRYNKWDSRLVEHEMSNIPGTAFKPKHEQTKYEAGSISPQPLRWLEESSDEISVVHNPLPGASLRYNKRDSRLVLPEDEGYRHTKKYEISSFPRASFKPKHEQRKYEAGKIGPISEECLKDKTSVVNQHLPDASIEYFKLESRPGETPNVTKYITSPSCYPRFLYTKRHAQNIIDDYKKIRLRFSILKKHVIDEAALTDISLYVVEPFATELCLHPVDLVLRHPERCRPEKVNFGEEFSKLYNSNYEDRTLAAVERFGTGKHKSLAAFLPVVNNDDMTVLEKIESKEIQVCLKENVNVKICEMLERDILLQMEGVYKDLDTDRCYVDSQKKSGNFQQNIPCTCSTEKGSCKCFERIMEDIKRLQADITGLMKRSKVPEDQKPQLNTIIGRKVEEKVIKALKKTSQLIDHCGYNLDTLYIFVNEEIPSQKLKADIDETMEKLRIKSYRIVSSHVNEYSNPASGSGVEVKATTGKALCGTLTGFGRFEEKQSLVAIMSRHLAIYSMDKKLYICHGSRYLTGDIMKQIFEIQKAEQDNSDEATRKPGGASNQHEKQIKSVLYPKIDVDMALASISEKDEHACDTRYRTDENEPVPGRLCVLDREQMNRLPVYIWGKTTKPGRGIISMSDIVPVNKSKKHLLMVEDRKDNTFCKEGDSGAMVCADDPDNYGEKVQLISMVMGSVSGQEGKYMTVKVKEGLEHIAVEVGENVNIC